MGEGEDSRGRDDDTQTVGDDGVVAPVAGRLVSLHIPRYGVGETVAEVNPRVTETNPGEGAGQVHLSPGCKVLAVVHSSGEILVDGLERRDCPDI